MRSWAGKFHLLGAMIGLLCVSASAQPGMTAQQLADQGRSFSSQRQFDRALESYREAVKLDAGLAAAQIGLGHTLSSLGRNEEALQPLETGLRLDPKNAFGHTALGIALGNLRRSEESLASLKTAHELNPKSAFILGAIGTGLSNMARFEESLAVAIKASELEPTNAAGHHNIGLGYLRLNRVAEAIEPFRTALKLKPDYKNARFHLSNSLSRTGRYAESIESWTKLMELDPNGPEVLSNRAWNYLYEGSHGRDAATDAQKFLSLYGWLVDSSAYQAFIAILGYRSANMEPEAEAVILQAEKKIDAGSWQHQIVKFLGGQITSAEFLKIAANNDQKTEAYAYIGMDLRIKGRRDEAKTYFKWVKEYGNQRFLEYQLALAELGRLGD